jgi:hypothetical protein
MSWEIVKEATDLLLIKSIIKDLDDRLTKKEILKPDSLWLSSSDYVIFMVKKNVVGKKVRKSLLKSVYYLRCLFFWKRNEFEKLDQELTNVIFELFPEEDIFNFIQGSLYLQKMLPFLKSTKRNMPKIIENLNSAYYFYNRAYKKSENKDIKVAINWSLAWMYYLTKKEDKFKREIDLIKHGDGYVLGKGWALWINWIGRNLSDDEIIFLTKQI